MMKLGTYTLEVKSDIKFEAGSRPWPLTPSNWRFSECTFRVHVRLHSVLVRVPIPVEYLYIFATAAYFLGKHPHILLLMPIISYPYKLDTKARKSPISLHCNGWHLWIFYFLQCSRTKLLAFPWFRGDIKLQLLCMAAAFTIQHDTALSF